MNFSLIFILFRGWVGGGGVFAQLETIEQPPVRKWVPRSSSHPQSESDSLTFCSSLADE